MILSYRPARAVQGRHLTLSHSLARQQVCRNLRRLFEQELACSHSVYCSEAFIVYSSSLVSRHYRALHRIASVCFVSSAVLRQSRPQAGVHNVSHLSRPSISLVLDLSQRSSPRYIVYIDCSLAIMEYFLRPDLCWAHARCVNSSSESQPRTTSLPDLLFHLAARSAIPFAYHPRQSRRSLR